MVAGEQRVGVENGSTNWSVYMHTSVHEGIFFVCAVMSRSCILFENSGEGVTKGGREDN